MATWLDYRDPGRIDAAMSELAGRRPEQWTAILASAGGDGRYALWLAIAFDHLAHYPPAGAADLGGVAWRDYYLAGWSPSSAACSAWAGNTANPESTAVVARVAR